MLRPEPTQVMEPWAVWVAEEHLLLTPVLLDSHHHQDLRSLLHAGFREVPRSVLSLSEHPTYPLGLLPPTWQVQPSQ